VVVISGARLGCENIIGLVRVLAYQLSYPHRRAQASFQLFCSRPVGLSIFQLFCSRPVSSNVFLAFLLNPGYGQLSMALALVVKTTYDWFGF